MFVNVSARTGQGVDELLDTILLQSDVLELKATREGLAAGVVVESSMEKGRGAVATVLVKRGVLKPGDPIIAGQEFGRVRAMFDENGQPVTEAGPSLPVVVLGLSGAPNAGDELLVVESERKAREVAVRRTSNLSATAAKTLGLQQIRDLIAGRISEAECIAAIQQATRRYAKRQLTWFQRQTNFEPLNLSLIRSSEAIEWIAQKARLSFAQAG